MDLTRSVRPHAIALRSLADTDPYPDYRAAAEEALVQWDETMQAWAVLGYEDCATVLKSESTFAMPWTILDGGAEAIGQYGVFNLQGDQHKRIHAELLDYFSPRKNPDLQLVVTRLVTESFARVAARRDFDFMTEIAERVPGLMGLAFIGVPEDEAVLPALHTANLRLQEYMSSLGDDPQALERLRDGHRHLADIWSPVFEARRKDPRRDFISKLLGWESEFGEISDQELVSQSLFMFGASFGNTANTIANAAYLLVADESLRSTLRSRPDRISTFVEEVLRVWGTVQFRVRIALTDTELGGCAIKAGDRVIPVVAAANREENQFTSADDVDLHRRGSGRHLTFGLGRRYCVGRILARLEVEEVSRAMLADDVHFALLNGELEPSFRGFNYRVWTPLQMGVTAGA